MKRHRSSASSAGILAVVMVVAGLVSTTPAQAQTYKYGPSGINPSYRVWVQITGTQVEIRGQFMNGDIAEDNGGVYSGTMNTSIPTVAGVSNALNFGVNNPTINGTGDNQHIVGWVSSTQFHIDYGSTFWSLNLESGSPPGKPPTVSITAPSGGATYMAPATVNITASASDTDGTIAKVEFYQGATKLGEDTSSSGGWSYTWNGATVGAYALKAKAYDNALRFRHWGRSGVGSGRWRRCRGLRQGRDTHE